jgi:hypothetical protein
MSPILAAAERGNSEPILAPFTCEECAEHTSRSSRLARHADDDHVTERRLCQTK